VSDDAPQLTFQFQPTPTRFQLARMGNGFVQMTIMTPSTVMTVFVPEAECLQLGDALREHGGAGLTLPNFGMPQPPH
jgi:hypothetical protein